MATPAEIKMNNLLSDLVVNREKKFNQNSLLITSLIIFVILEGREY